MRSTDDKASKSVPNRLYRISLALLALPLAFFMYDSFLTSQSVVWRENFIYKELLPSFKTASPSLLKMRGEQSPFIADEICKRKKSVPHEFLCHLQATPFCKSVQPADSLSHFWVLGAIYSYDQEKTPLVYDLHQNFRYYMESYGLSWCTIEGIFKGLNQSYLVTGPEQTNNEMRVELYDLNYIRENMLNVALRRIPNETWEHVAWIDAHQVFKNNYWWEESLIKMERNNSVQLLQETVRLTIRNTTIIRKRGSLHHSLVAWDLDAVKPEWPEVGNGYGIRKEKYWELGTILDTCVAGGCDLGYVKSSIASDMKYDLFHSEYFDQFYDWVDHARTVFNASRAAVRGELSHLEHEHYLDFRLMPKYYYEAGFNVTTDILRHDDFIIELTNKNVSQVVSKMDWNFYVNS